MYNNFHVRDLYKIQKLITVDVRTECLNAIIISDIRKNAAIYLYFIFSETEILRNIYDTVLNHMVYGQTNVLDLRDKLQIFHNNTKPTKRKRGCTRRGIIDSLSKRNQRNIENEKAKDLPEYVHEQFSLF